MTEAHCVMKRVNLDDVETRRYPHRSSPWLQVGSYVTVFATGAEKLRRDHPTVLMLETLHQNSSTGYQAILSPFFTVAATSRCNPSVKRQLLPRVQRIFDLRRDRPKVLWLHQKHTKELFQMQVMVNDSWVSAQRTFDSRGT